MSRNFALFLCLSLLSIVALYQLRPVAKHPARSTEPFKPTVQPIAINLSVGFPTNDTLVPTTQSSNCADTLQLEAANTPAVVLGKTANNDQPELLRRLREWAAKNPEGALAAVLKLPDCDERNHALAAVCYGVAQDDPEAAIEVAQTLKLDKQSGQIMPNLIQEWATSDFFSALNWVNNQPASNQRNDWTERIAFALSQTEPADAETLVLTEIPPGAAQNKAVLKVLDQWADKDVDGAIAWANGFPEGPLRNEALEKLEHQRAVSQ